MRVGDPQPWLDADVWFLRIDGRCSASVLSPLGYGHPVSIARFEAGPALHDIEKIVEV
jgi:hypothetical protein